MLLAGSVRVASESQLVATRHVGDATPEYETHLTLIIANAEEAQAFGPGTTFDGSASDPIDVYAYSADGEVVAADPEAWGVPACIAADALDEGRFLIRQVGRIVGRSGRGRRRRAGHGWGRRQFRGRGRRRRGWS